MVAIFADDISRCIFINGKFCILIKILLKFIPKGLINNKPALTQIMAWRRIGDKPLSESTLTRFTDAYMRHQEVEGGGGGVKPLPLIWRSGTLRWNLQAPDLRMSAVTWLKDKVS